MRLLLAALLVHSTFGDKESVEVDSHYKGQQCNSILNPRDYFRKVNNVQIPSVINGDPHYLWGDALNKGSLLYCAKITTNWNFVERVHYTLSIPRDVLKGTIISIQVMDRNNPEKGGDVKLDEGGVGRRSASLSFKALRWKIMDYVVAVFGQRNRQ